MHLAAALIVDPLIIYIQKLWSTNLHFAHNWMGACMCSHSVLLTWRTGSKCPIWRYILILYTCTANSLIHTLDACELTYMQPCAFLRRSGLEGWRRGGGGGEGGPHRPRAVPGAYIEHLRSGQRNPGRLLVTIWCSLPVADIVYMMMTQELLLIVLLMKS